MALEFFASAYPGNGPTEPWFYRAVTLCPADSPSQSLEKFSRGSGVFKMAIKQVLNALVLGARFVQVDGRNYASVFLVEDNEGENDAGMIPLKVAVDPAKFLEVKTAIKECESVPAALSLETVMKPAAGGGMKMEVVGVVKINPTAAQRAKEASLSSKSAAAT